MAAAGCQHCRHTGYDGRVALFEICLVSARLQDLITQASPESVLHTLAVEEGMMAITLDEPQRQLLEE